MSLSSIRKIIKYKGCFYSVGYMCDKRADLRKGWLVQKNQGRRDGRMEGREKQLVLDPAAVS